MLYFSIWSEKVQDKGEDAPPTMLLDEHQKTGLMAVYDGMGGAGAKEYTLPINESYASGTVTGAYLAAHLAKETLEEVFSQEASYEEIFQQVDVSETLLNSFQAQVALWDTQPSKIKSKLIKRLPTTLAGVFFKEDAQEAAPYYEVHTFWAGDSRTYVLNNEGLLQLSQDDLQEAPDALENLLHDGIMSNCINADTPFTVHTTSSQFTTPLLLITATDGCFNYLPSPAHFEYLILSCLYHPKTCTLHNWQQRLTQNIVQVTGDDASLGLVALGFEKDLMAIKLHFIDRFQQLKFKFIDPINQLEHQISFLKGQETEIKATLEVVLRKRNMLRERLWQEYKKLYEYKDESK